jgi:hypothetical protein
VFYSEISQTPELEVLLILKIFKNLEWAVRYNKIKELPNTSGNPAALVVPHQLKQLFNLPTLNCGKKIYQNCISVMECNFLGSLV